MTDIPYCDALKAKTDPFSVRRMEARIKELEAALSSAQADREALMEVVRVVGAWRISAIPCTRYKIREAYEALPAHLRSEAEGKATP